MIDTTGISTLGKTSFGIVRIAPAPPSSISSDMTYTLIRNFSAALTKPIAALSQCGIHYWQGGANRKGDSRTIALSSGFPPQRARYPCMRPRNVLK